MAFSPGDGGSLLQNLAKEINQPIAWRAVLPFKGPMWWYNKVRLGRCLTSRLLAAITSQILQACDGEALWLSAKRLPIMDLPAQAEIHTVSILSQPLVLTLPEGANQVDKTSTAARTRHAAQMLTFEKRGQPGARPSSGDHQTPLLQCIPTA